MKTKIEKIGGKKKVVVTYKNQAFILQCDPNDVKYFKNNFDVMINRFKTDLLDSYNEFLMNNGYCDTDIISEEPTAKDRFLTLNEK